MKRTALFTLVALAAACGSRTGLDPFQAEPPATAPSVQAPAACGPSTCAGCCDGDGVCQPGTAVAACGEAGRACVGCDPAVDVCSPDPRNPDGQVCFSPCAFKACNYHCCTPAGECVAGDSDDRCGSTGQICANCAGAGQVCDTSSWPHACVSR